MDNNNECLSVSTNEGNSPLAITMVSNRELAEYVFDFGDGVIIKQTEPKVSHTYKTSGYYTARLITNEGDKRCNKLISVKNKNILTATTSDSNNSIWRELSAKASFPWWLSLVLLVMIVVAISQYELTKTVDNVRTIR